MQINLSRPELALNGGRPVRTKPWLDNITTGNEEKMAAMRVFDSGYLSLFEGSHTPDLPFSFKGGPEVQALEEEWCDYYNVKYSISMNSATSGLYASIGALGIGYGDEVIVSPYTMTACAMAPMIYGAIPVFADVEMETGCLDPNSIEQNVSERTRAILVIHQFGIPANMERIMAIAKKHNLFVIEDCAQAHGAEYKGKYVGTIGDIGVFSMNVNKSIQSGEGCVCTTNDEDLCYRLQLIRNHGEAVVGTAGYEDITNIAGFNYRLSELHAAIIREQLKKLDSLNNTRLKLVQQLTAGLNKLKFLTTPNGRELCESTYYVFPLRFFSEKAGLKREDFVTAVNAEGIQFYEGYSKPLYLQPLYQRKHLYKFGYPFSAKENQACNMNYNKGICPNAEQLHFHEMIINEHIRHPHTAEDIEDIIKAIKKVFY
jgi:dTDP-4-amino-4,6-dideoxygalactose transaminase